jgi:hypothetical protein
LAALDLALFSHQYFPGVINATGFVAAKDKMLPMLKNESLGIIPEGVAGCTHGATPEEEKIFINERFGFVKIAIQAGAGTYNFGVSVLLC